MRRFWTIVLLAAPVIFYSCEKCMRCSYTYTVTTIQQTVNGEQEVVTTYTSWIIDEDSTYLKEECIKKNDDQTFTIETKYQLFADTTTLDDFAYTCEEL